MAAPIKHVMHVVGARPNIMKLGPLWHEIEQRGVVSQSIIHTGQHYDDPLSAELFEDFQLPAPVANLGVGGLQPVKQFGEVILRLADVLLQNPPSLLMTYGDVRSTPASAIAAHHCGIPAAHYEAGLRAHNRIWPEEFHRVAAYIYCDILFATEPLAFENARNERGSAAGIHLVGDLMCDAARLVLERGIGKPSHKLPSGSYLVFTAHHTNNVDSKAGLERVLSVIEHSCLRLPVFFPMHPRTSKRIEEFGLSERLSSIRGLTVTGPVRYSIFMQLVTGATAVLTDSGSLSVECAYLKKPMLYLHPVMERQLAMESGALALTGMDPLAVARELDRVLDGGFRMTSHPLLDGKAARKIADIVEDTLAANAPRQVGIA